MFLRIQKESLKKECIRVRIRGAFLAKKGAPKLNFHREGGGSCPHLPPPPLNPPLDIAIFSDTAPGLQLLLTEYNSLARQMGLRINTSKTETMCFGTNADFFIDDTKLANVTRFKYLGSYVTNDCSMNEELASRIQATSCAFGLGRL